MSINQKNTKLISFRLKHRIKLCELSHASKINNSKLSRIENGWLEPTEEEIRKICSGYKALNVPAAFTHIG